MCGEGSGGASLCDLLSPGLICTPAPHHRLAGHLLLVHSASLPLLLSFAFSCSHSEGSGASSLPSLASCTGPPHRHHGCHSEVQPCLLLSHSPAPTAELRVRVPRGVLCPKQGWGPAPPAPCPVPPCRAAGEWGTPGAPGDTAWGGASDLKKIQKFFDDGPLVM